MKFQIYNNLTLVYKFDWIKLRGVQPEHIQGIVKLGFINNLIYY